MCSSDLVTPFAVGEFTGYTEAVDVNGLGRAYAAAGVRTSLPFWRTFPGVESGLWNVHGLAHKISFDVDYLYAYANQSYLTLPYLDQADDDTSELVRRQNLFRQQADLIAQYGTATPQQFDPRFYALRQNVWWLPDSLDNMQNFRVALDQKLQTKQIGRAHG